MNWKPALAIAAWLGCSIAIARPVGTSDVGLVEASATLASHDLAPGTTIEVPSAWTFSREPGPPQSRAAVIPIAGEGMHIRITAMSGMGPMPPMGRLAGMLEKADRGFLPDSQEKAFNPVTFESPTARGVLASFTAEDPAHGFDALLTERSARLTNALVAKDDAFFTITVSLETVSDAGLANQQAAIAAIQAIR